MDKSTVPTDDKLARPHFSRSRLPPVKSSDHTPSQTTHITSSKVVRFDFQAEFTH